MTKCKAITIAAVIGFTVSAPTHADVIMSVGETAGLSWSGEVTVTPGSPGQYSPEARLEFVDIPNFDSGYGDFGTALFPSGEVDIVRVHTFANQIMDLEFEPDPLNFAGDPVTFTGSYLGAPGSSEWGTLPQWNVDNNRFGGAGTWQLQLIPEPATLTLLALGGLLAIRRRR